MRRALFLLLVTLVCVSSALATGNETVNTVPGNNPSFIAQTSTFLQNELPNILGRYFPTGWVYDGGVHGTSGTCVSPSFHTEAFTGIGNRVTEGIALSSVGFINYLAAGVSGCTSGSSTVGVAVCALSANSSGNWNRYSTSKYFLDTTNAADTVPSDCARLMTVTIASGVITTVDNDAVRSPIAAAVGIARINGTPTAGQLAYWTDAATIGGASTLDVDLLYAASHAAIFASDYGVLCDGTTNDATALTNAFAAAVNSTQGSTLIMPAGSKICKLNSTVIIQNAANLVFEGNGVKFTWGGASNIPMFTVRDSQHSKFQHFFVAVSTAVPLQEVMRFENGAGATLTPTNNIVENVNIQCTNGGCTTGFRMFQGAGGDNNNEFNLFKNIVVNNHGGQCVLIDHSQSKHNILEDFSCNASTSSPVGNYIVNTTAGGFHCIRCNGGWSAIADFYLTQTTNPILISQGNFENSARLLETAGPSSAESTVTIENTRWAINASALNADNRMIKFQFKGPLVLINNEFEPATANKALEIYYNPGGGTTGGELIAIGNFIGSTLTDPFTGFPPTVALGNSIDRNDAAGSVHLPHEINNYTSLAELATTGTVPAALTYTGAAHTALTASTERSDVYWNSSANRQWSTGALNLQRFHRFATPTVSFVGASTLTDACTICVDGGPIASTNATITQSHGILVRQANVAAGTTRGYGMTVQAPTGAGTNYSAVFTGGNVGVGTSQPSVALHVGTGTGGKELRIESSDNNAVMSITGAGSARGYYGYLGGNNGMFTASAALAVGYDSTGRMILGSITFSNLGTPSNGAFAYCSDCTIANPCAGSGTGALAKRLNGVWVCN